MKNSSEIFIISSPGGLGRLKDILEEYQVYDYEEDSAYLTYGYKTLHDGAKQTYRVLKYQAKALKKNPVKISLEILSIILGTTEEAQSARIKQLEKHNLVTVTKRPYELNQYKVNDPLPDFTFAETIYKLIRRQMLGEAIFKLKKSSNPIEKISIYEEIRNLTSLGAAHQDLEQLPSLLLE